jgi:hypothetical protein
MQYYTLKWFDPKRREWHNTVPIDHETAIRERQQMLAITPGLRTRLQKCSPWDAGPAKRKVHVAGQVWTWGLGSRLEHVRIVGPDGKAHAADTRLVVGIEDLERARRKGYLHITPGQVKAYIEREFGKRG